MKILSFDTCNAIASAAITDEENILSYSIEDNHSKQAEKLISLIDNCLNNCNLQLSDIDKIAVTIGPGSFTGTRIGISVASGFFIATRIPVIAITCFEALAYNNLNDDNVVLIDAKGDQFYLQKFSEYNKIDENLIINSADIDKYISKTSKILSNNISIFSNNIEKNNIYNTPIDAKLVGIAAFKKIKYGLPANELKPIYLRKMELKKRVTNI